jgi:hypothetical protein
VSIDSAEDGRFTYLMNGFSKTLERRAATVALYFMYLQLRSGPSDAPREASNGSVHRGSRLVD